MKNLNPGDFIKIKHIKNNNDYQEQKLRCLNVGVGQIYKVLQISTISIVLKTQYKSNIHIRHDVFETIEYEVLKKDSPELKITFFE